ncbi:MAG: fibronectin type III domain-containing protein, partial [Patescibacteria group bacterium]
AGKSTFFKAATLAEVEIASYPFTTIKPNATSTTFGSGLADGGRSGESITVSGFGFGVAPVGSRGNCAGAVDTGCVRFTMGGTATVATGDVTAWSNTSITFTINASLASNGGTSGMEVVAGSQADATPLTFFIYPNVTGMTTCASGGNRDSVCGTNAAQEYSASDTFGLIQLNGDHFSASAGTVSFTGAFGSISGTVHGSIAGPCAVAGWTSTSVCVQVSSSISNTVYDGTVTLTRTGDSKTSVISLHILPRKTSNSPTTGVVGTVVTIDGDHFCQTGTCPVSPPTSDYIVYFGSTTAVSSDFVATGNCTGQGVSFSDTRICVKVPAGTPTGSQNTKVQGKATPLYESQRQTFSVLTTIPDSPTNLNQYKSNGTTVIAVGGVTEETTVVLKADISVSVSTDIALQIEKQPISTAFVCGSGDCASAQQGTVVGGGACTSCTSLNAAKVTITSLGDNTYHWQARVRNTSTNEYSAWVSFGGNAESATDFYVDTTGPVITSISSNTPGTNSATITWLTSGEMSTSQVQYNTTGTFVTNCATNNDCTTLDPTLVNSHSVGLSNLNSGTTYYYRVRSV